MQAWQYLKGGTVGSLKAIRTILVMEAIGFVAIAVLLWFDEIFDLPYMVLGAEPTPANYAEVAVECGFVLIFGAIVMAISLSLARRIMRLESLFPVCLVCEKVCMPGGDPEKQESWKETDLFVIDKAGTHLANSLCPACKGRRDPASE